MKKQMRLNGRKSKRNVLIVGMLTTVLIGGTLLTTGTVGLVSTVDAATSTNGVGTTASALTKFKDIKGHWAQATIVKAYDKNLISGYQDGTFRPNAKITRGEYATLLSRATSLEKVQGENPLLISRDTGLNQLWHSWLGKALLTLMIIRKDSIPMLS